MHIALWKYTGLYIPVSDDYFILRLLPAPPTSHQTTLFMAVAKSQGDPEYRIRLRKKLLYTGYG